MNGEDDEEMLLWVQYSVFRCIRLIRLRWLGLELERGSRSRLVKVMEQTTGINHCLMTWSKTAQVVNEGANPLLSLHLIFRL